MRIEHGKVEACIEHLLLRRVLVGYLEHLELLLPFLLCGLTYLVESVSLGFSLPVALGTFEAHARDAHLYLQWSSAGGEAQHGSHVARQNVPRLRAPTVVIERGQRKGFVEAGIEIAVLARCPAIGDAIAAYGLAVDNLDARDEHRVTEAFGQRGGPRGVAAFHVDGQAGLRSLREGIAMQAASLGGRQLHADLLVGQHEAVVARHRLFLIVAVAGMDVARKLRAAVPFAPRDGHHTDVLQVAAPVAVGMCVAEAVYVDVCVVVARPAVVGVWPQLYHAEGGHGQWDDTSVQ